MYNPIAIHRYTYTPIKAQSLYNKNMNITIAAKHQNNISSIIFIIGLKFLSILILLQISKKTPVIKPDRKLKINNPNCLLIDITIIYKSPT